MPWVFKVFALHAYAVLFGWVLIEQGGLPIPSVPLMLAAGGMSAAHKLHIAYALPLILLACLISDSLWYWLGRRYGSRVLELLCRFSLEPPLASPAPRAWFRVGVRLRCCLPSSCRGLAPWPPPSRAKPRSHIYALRRMRLPAR